MATQNEKPSASQRRIVLKNVVLSYPHLFEARAAAEGADPKFSTSILISKDNQGALSAVQGAMKAAITDAIPTKWGGKKPTGLKMPLRDGDEKDEFGDFVRSGSEYRNVYYLNASSKTRVGVVTGPNREPAMPDDVWPGEFAIVSITLFGYSAAGNKGVAAGLNNVWVLGRGERLDGGMNPEDEFANVQAEFGANDDDLSEYLNDMAA